MMPPLTSLASVYEDEKEPWQIRRDVFIWRARYALYGRSFSRKVMKDLDCASRAYHKQAVAAALGEGKPVPAEVLADYPDLNLPLPSTVSDRKVTKEELEAEERFIEWAMDTAGITREQAVDALNIFLKYKLIKIDPIGGQFTFRHGIWKYDADVLRRAAAKAKELSLEGRKGQPHLFEPLPSTVSDRQLDLITNFTPHETIETKDFDEWRKRNPELPPWMIRRVEFITLVAAGQFDFKLPGYNPPLLKTLRILAMEHQDMLALRRLDVEAARFHEAAVTTAFVEGKPVPDEVLADYPELAAIRRAKQTWKEARQHPTDFGGRVRDRQGRIGQMLEAGEVVLTASGRETTPFPKIHLDTDRKTALTVKRVDKWLYENALAEAEARGDDFNATSFRQENPARLPQATKDGMEEYLFGGVI